MKFPLLSSRFPAITFAAFGSLLLFIPSILAQSGTWTGGTNSWSNTGSWTGTVADGADFTADFSSATAASIVTLDTAARTIGNLTFGNAMTLASGTNVLTLQTTTGGPAITLGASNVTISAILAGNQGFTKTGTGTLLLSGANTFSGSLTISQGTLQLGNTNALGTTTLSFASGTTFNIGNGSTVFTSNAMSVATGATVNLASGNAAAGYSGLITGDATSKIVILTGTQVNMDRKLNEQQYANFLGTVQVDSGGSLRFSASSALNNGGANTTFDVIGTITARNTGTVHLGALTGSGSITGSSGADGTTTYIIGEKNTNSTFSGVISNANSLRIARVTKSGTGTLTLSGTNTYTGATFVNAGTLALGANNVLADTSAITLAGGTLAAATFTDTLGTLNLTAISSITLGAGGALAFADSSALNWGVNTLSITGTFVDGSSIRFGTTATGITSTQLALITINGQAAFIDASGFLSASAVPEPATYAALAGLSILGFAAFRRRRA